MNGRKFIQMFETRNGSELVFLGQLDILEDLGFDDVLKRVALPNGRKGKWIAYAENNTPIMLRCSMCSHSVVWGSIANYCPNCGCEMENE